MVLVVTVLGILVLCKHNMYHMSNVLLVPWIAGERLMKQISEEVTPPGAYKGSERNSIWPTN